MNKKSFFRLSLILLLILICFYLLLKPYYDFSTKVINVSPAAIIFGNKELKSTHNQTNILILGISGPGHDGPDLSDSIIVASIDFNRKQLNTISIPRDIWSDTLKDKINSAYAYGAVKQTTGGLVLSKAEVAAIVGIPIHYAVVIDFSEFEKLIDYLGGITINIENSFTDKLFPISGKEADECNNDPEYKCRYETVSFVKGLNHLNGKTALKYVRSRNGNNNEGNDFARSSRQQKVINAIKEKIISFIYYPDVGRLTKLYRNIDRLLIRDIPNQSLAILAKKMIISKNYLANQISLPEDLFIVPEYSDYDGKYVLIPKSGNFDALKTYIECRTKQSNCKIE